MLETDNLNEHIGFGITAKLSGNRSPPTQHRNISILSASMMGYTLIASQLFIFAIADPLSELEQKVDSPCLPNLELLSFAIADPFSGLTNLADLSCLLICDRTQTISMDSMDDIGLGITAKLSGKRSPPTQHRNISILSAPMLCYTSIASQLFISYDRRSTV